jgi:hypothetical protein
MFEWRKNCARDHTREIDAAGNLRPEWKPRQHEAYHPLHPLHPLHSLQEQVDLCAPALANLTPVAEMLAVVLENVIAALAQFRARRTM